MNREIYVCHEEWGCKHDYPHSHRWLCDMCDNPWPHLHIVSLEKALTFGSCDIGGRTWDRLLESKARDTVQMNALLDVICDEGVRPGYCPAVDRSDWKWGNGYFVDGHHRITLLYLLGAQWIPIQFRQCHASDTPSYREAKKKAYADNPHAW